MSRNVRWIAVLVLLTVLTVGTAQAGPVAPRSLRAAAPVAGLVEEAWEWLSALFRRPEPRPASRPPTVSQGKEGCGMDPMGRPVECR